MESAKEILQDGIQKILGHVAGPGFSLKSVIRLRDQFFLSAVLSREDTMLVPTHGSSLRAAALDFFDNPDQPTVDAMLNYQMEYAAHQVFSPGGVSASLVPLVGAQKALAKLKPLVENAVQEIMKENERSYNYKLGKVAKRTNELEATYWFVTVSVREGEGSE